MVTVFESPVSNEKVLPTVTCYRTKLSPALIDSGRAFENIKNEAFQVLLI